MGAGGRVIPNIKIFTDASTIAEIRGYAAEPWVSGFTTNPTLMRKGGVTHYREFAVEAIEAAEGKPLSLEVASVLIVEAASGTASGAAMH